MKKFVFAVLSSTLMACAIAQATEVQVASRRIDITMQGSLNSIAGTGEMLGGPIDLPDGAKLTRLDFELLSFTTTPDVGLPESTGLGFSYPSPQADGVGVAFNLRNGPVHIGQIVSIEPFGVAINYRNPLLGLFVDFGQPAPQIVGGGSWPFGGVNASGMASYEMRVFADMTTPVPETAMWSQLGAGVALIGLLSRRRVRGRFLVNPIS